MPWLSDNIPAVSKNTMILIFTSADQCRIESSKVLCIYPYFLKDEEISSILELAEVKNVQGVYFINPTLPLQESWQRTLNRAPFSSGAVSRLDLLIDEFDPYSLFDELKNTLNSLVGGIHFSLKNMCSLITYVTGASIVILGADKRLIIDNRQADAPSVPFQDWASHLENERFYSSISQEEVLFTSKNEKWHGNILMAYGSISAFFFMQGLSAIMAPDEIQRKLLRPYILMARVGEINFPAQFKKRKNEFIFSLIFGLNNSRETVIKESQFYNLDFTELRYVWIMHLYNYDQKIHNMDRILRMCESAFPKNIFLSDHDQIISIHEKDDESDESSANRVRQLMRRVENLYPQIQCQVGNSRAYPDLFEMKHAYQDAMFTLRMGQFLSPRIKKFLTYNDYLLYHFLSGQRENPILQRLYRNSVDALRKNDEEFNEHLLETLSVLSQKDFHLSEASKALGLHRNTMYLRLDKISHITGIDVRSPEGRLLMLMALKLDLINSFSCS